MPLLSLPNYGSHLLGNTQLHHPVLHIVPLVDSQQHYRKRTGGYTYTVDHSPWCRTRHLAKSMQRRNMLGWWKILLDWL